MSSPNTDRYSVLIADDSEVCCGLLALVLKNADYDVICVYDGQKAIEAVRSLAFDLVILDNEMPKLDGLATLEGIRAIHPRLPVMVCSGTVSPDQVTSYERMGVETLFSKPINPLRLKERVAKIVEHHRQLAAADSHHEPVSRSHTPFLAPGIDARILEKPFFSGVSAAARKLVGDFMRVRGFKTAATLEGRPGTGFLDVAVAMAEAKNALLLACPAAEVSEMKLIMLFAPALLQERGVILIITNAEQLNHAQQAVLEGLYTGEGALDPYYLGKVSLIFCAEASLHELADAGQFDEHLLLRAGAMTQRLPDLSQRREDIFLIARAVLRRIGAGRVTFTHASQVWLEKQTWPGDYRQLHRTVELACRMVGESEPIDVTHLAAAYSKEPRHKDPLFHETLLETLYEFTGLENL
jgi:two-component system response regulator HydG